MNYYFNWEEIRNKELKTIKKFRAIYQENGFVIIENILDRSEISNLSNIYNGISKYRKEKHLKPFISHLMPHTWDERILEIAKLKSIISSVEIIVGGKADLLHSQITFKAPGDEGFSLHQDNYYNRANPPNSMTAVWIAIDDADDKNGSLIVYPFTQEEGILPVKRNWKYIFKKAPKLIPKKIHQLISKSSDGYDKTSGVVEQFANSIVPKKYKPFTLNIKAGSIAFMHGNLVHSSGINTSKYRFRRNLLLNYIRQGSSFNSGIISRRKKLDIY
tara:strand:- start:1595 stop:2416 length:822 start_codon:yes stop_codon:yes gene_type:complete